MTLISAFVLVPLLARVLAEADRVSGLPWWIGAIGAALLGVGLVVLVPSRRVPGTAKRPLSPWILEHDGSPVAELSRPRAAEQFWAVWDVLPAEDEAARTTLFRPDLREECAFTLRDPPTGAVVEVLSAGGRPPSQDSRSGAWQIVLRNHAALFRGQTIPWASDETKQAQASDAV